MKERIYPIWNAYLKASRTCMKFIFFRKVLGLTYLLQYFHWVIMSLADGME